MPLVDAQDCLILVSNRERQTVPCRSRRPRDGTSTTNRGTRLQTGLARGPERSPHAHEVAWSDRDHDRLQQISAEAVPA